MKQRTKRLLLPLKNIWPISRISRSLFSKYLFACISVILLCFLFLGIMVIVISVRYSNNQKMQLYRQSAKYIAAMATELTGSPNGNTIMASALGSITYSTEANIIITDSSGDVMPIIGNRFQKSDVLKSTVPASVMSVINSGTKSRYSDVGDFGGFYARSYITEGVPIVSGGTVIGGVFVSSPADSLIGYVQYIIQFFIICLVAVFVFAFIAVYYMTLRMVRPLKQMSSAARDFAKGNFDIRVPVGDKDEIGQLAVAFNNMAASLTTLENMRRSFVANVSHELKTPMTSIAGFIDGILDGTIPEEKREYYLKVVSDEVKRLSRLVRQFLDIARIEAGELKINPSDFDIEETVRRVIVGFEYAINEKKISILGLDEDADRKVMVRSDPDLTHQILYNLVDNAVKFANEGGRIEIRVVSRGHRVYVSVKNSGMGIPASELPFVFERFYKTDKSRALDRKGVGLGLYIAKTVLNQQNEDITVKSEEGKYCEFVFTLKSAG